MVIGLEIGEWLEKSAAFHSKSGSFENEFGIRIKLLLRHFLLTEPRKTTCWYRMIFSHPGVSDSEHTVC